ncbi:MAG: hypothetical protein QM484_03630 [Woeseiaceae bacterium]
MTTIMKKHTTLPFIGIVLLLVFSSCMADKKPDQAWWLNISIAPDKTVLNNINITTYNKNWRSAVFLDEKLIKTHVTKRQFSEFKNSKFKLSSNVDLNGNNEKETIKVGVYQNSKNDKGIFLAVFEKHKLLKVFTDSSNQGFSALIKDNKSIRWYKCMNCGEYEHINWNGKSYVIQ